MAIEFVTPTLTEKQTKVFNECLKSFDGLTYKEVEEILYELLSKAKTISLVTQQSVL